MWLDHTWPRTQKRSSIQAPTNPVLQWSHRNWSSFPTKADFNWCHFKYSFWYDIYILVWASSNVQIVQNSIHPGWISYGGGKSRILVLYYTSHSLGFTSPFSRSKCTYTCMWLTPSDGRFAICNFFLTFSIFCKHPSKFTCHPIFWVPERKNRCCKLGVGCGKSESDTCKQPNINEKKGKNRCRKSAVRCREPHTCVCALRVMSGRGLSASHVLSRTDV